MKVAIIGAGIGGLALAHGLRSQGIEVAVYERDLHLDDTAGYRLHLDADAYEILTRILPNSSLKALTVSASPAQHFRQFTIADTQLRALIRIPRDGTENHLLIGRKPLRKILARGLEDFIAFGLSYQGFTVNNNTVSAYFNDGSTMESDVLVAADGVRSAIALAIGYPKAVSLSYRGVAGRTVLTEQIRRLITPELSRGPVFAVGPDRTAVFLSLHQPCGLPSRSATCSEAAPIVEDPAVMWGITHKTQLDTSLSISLQAQGLVSHWPSTVRSIVEATAPETISEFPYYGTKNIKKLVAPTLTAIAAIGDAVHPMPPTGGRGATTAIRDAYSLASWLSRANQGACTLSEALGQHHRTMTELARQAVTTSLRPLKWLDIVSNPLAYNTFRAVAPLTDATLQLLQRLRRP